jgi:GMP synthase-like glutamine amidotransferase
VRTLLISHEKAGGPGVIGEILKSRGIETQRHIILGEDGELNLNFPDPSEFDFIISFGSFHSAYDPEVSTWVDAEEVVITKSLDKEVPVLGVCFGGQVLAKAVGGSVEKSYELELGELHIKETSLGLPFPEGPWFSWHSDRMILPDHIEVLAETPSAVQVFRHKTAVGLQFHPEATPELVQSWLDIGGADYLPAGMTSDLLMAEVNNMAQDAAENCELLVDWFISEYVSAKST